MKTNEQVRCVKTTKWKPTAQSKIKNSSLPKYGAIYTIDKTRETEEGVMLYLKGFDMLNESGLREAFALKSEDGSDNFVKTEVIPKIDTKNGILSEGEIYHCLGKGSHELDDQAREILGVKALYRGEKEGLVADQRGCLYQDDYYLTTEQAEKWNAHIEEQELLEKAKALTPEGATFLGRREGAIKPFESNLEIGALLDEEVKKGDEDFMWTPLNSQFVPSAEVFYYTRTISKPDPLMERAIELAVDGIELLGYGRPESYEIKEGYECSFISSLTPNLNHNWRVSDSLTWEDVIYFQRKIKEESEPDLSHLNKGQLTRLEHDSWVAQLTGNKPVDPHGSNYGIMCQMARALYGKGGSNE